MITNQGQFNTIGISTNLNLQDRPLTNQGLGTAGRQTAQGPRRRFHDRTYYVSKLKTSNRDLANEITKFQSEIETIKKDHDVYQQLERRFEDLSKEVRELEGKLADYNLAFDKHRAGTKPDDIRNIYGQIKRQNDRYRHQLDELFVERKTQDDQIGRIEHELISLQERAEIKMNELDTHQRKEYEGLQGENNKILIDINRSKQEFEELTYKVHQQENRLRMDQQRMRVINLKEEIKNLESKKSDLDIQLNESNMSIPELRERLLSKLKEDKERMVEASERTRDLKRAIDNIDKRVR
jgi:intraflagellar transport protein 74